MLASDGCRIVPEMRHATYSRSAHPSRSPLDPGKTHSASKPCEANRSVRLFSLTVLTTFSGVPSGNLLLDPEGDTDLGAYEAGEVSDDLVGETAGIPADPGRIECDAAVEARGLNGCMGCCFRRVVR